MAKGIIKKVSPLFIKIKVLTKELEFKAQKTQEKHKNDQERNPWRVSLRLQ